MKNKLKSYLKRIAVFNEMRFGAITGLLDELEIPYEVQSKTFVRKVPVYEEKKPKPAKATYCESSIAREDTDSIEEFAKDYAKDGKNGHFFDLNDGSSIDLTNFPESKGIEADSGNPEEDAEESEQLMAYLEQMAEMEGMDISSMSREELAQFAALATMYMGYPLSYPNDEEEELEGYELDTAELSERSSVPNIYLGEDDFTYKYSKGYQTRKVIRYEEEYDEIRNIIIPLRNCSNKRKKKKLVFMAHYDAVPKSTGANDNGSAIAILIAFAQEVIQRGSEYPIEIVFTDREECGGYGATMYEEENKTSILEIINLDTCGVGEDIVTCDWSLHPSGLTWKYIYGAELEDIRPVFVRSLPYCDADNMRNKGHDVTGICVLPRKDTLGIIYGRPRYTETYQYIHNGKKDDISYINYDIMEKLLQYICLILN